MGTATRIISRRRSIFSAGDSICTRGQSDHVTHRVSGRTNFIDKIGHYPVLTARVTPFKLWRLRKFKNLFKSTDELWEPPNDKTPLGRCNAPGSPVLYTSEDLETPFEELNVKENEQVYGIKFEVKEELNLKKIVSNDFVATDNKGNRIYDDESMLSYQILRDFVRSEFLKPVGKNTEYLHKISSSMCRVWFHDDDSDGWIYPSVQTPGKNNIALKQISARKKLKIVDIRIVRLVQKNNVKNHIDKFKSHPFYKIVSMAIETDFVGSIVDENINWYPSNDVGGYLF